YGWMLRGDKYWRQIPEAGKRGFSIMVSWADRFNRATLERHPDAGAVWVNRMNTAALGGEDWLPIFDHAVEVDPSRRKLYYDAMDFALDQWGGNHALRERIQATAIAK